MGIKIEYCEELEFTYKHGIRIAYPKIKPFFLIHGGSRGVPRMHPKHGRPTAIKLTLTISQLKHPYVQRLIKDYSTIVHPSLPTANKIHLVLRNG